MCAGAHGPCKQKQADCSTATRIVIERRRIVLLDPSESESRSPIVMVMKKKQSACHTRCICRCIVCVCVCFLVEHKKRKSSMKRLHCKMSMINVSIYVCIYIEKIN